MSGPRSILALTLALLPLALFAVVGTWALWQTGLFLYTWWVLPVCWGAAFLVARRWRGTAAPLPGPASAAPAHWTARDRAALALVEARQATVCEIPPERLTEPELYFETAKDLAGELARHYHPRSKEPLGAVTIPELLAAASLVFEELEERIDEYVPGSHLLTVNQWRALARSPVWFRRASELAWGVATLLEPLNLGRYVASKATVEPFTKQVKTNVLAAFYALFVRDLGTYLIELNSGRLRGGATKYREALAGARPEGVRIPVQPESAAQGQEQEQEQEPGSVTLALVGQVNAGKSSLINALLGQEQAAVDVLPRTREVARYRLELAGSADSLTLLDTPGYGDAGATAAQLEEARTACRRSDLVLFVMDVQNPARQPDLDVLQAMTDWYGARAHRKLPPVLGVLTHIDGLSPAKEWSPPYEWSRPERPKERQMRAAVDYVQRELAPHLAGVVPVCSDVERGRVYGVEEWLLPAMTTLLDEARACAMLRSLHRDLERGKVRKVFEQLKNAGTALMKTF